MSTEAAKEISEQEEKRPLDENNEQQEETPNPVPTPQTSTPVVSTKWRFALAAGLVVGGAVLAPVAVVAAVHAVGFGTTGVVAGSIAASMQTATTAAGSAFAVAQSIGATGVVGASANAAGAAVGGITAAVANRFLKRSERNPS